MGNKEIKEELSEKFPLLDMLAFYRTGGFVDPETLPPIIALLSSMTDPDIEGDFSVLIPNKYRVATYTAILSAFSAVREHFPHLLKKYVTEGFEIGEYVRVLPSGHVYQFAGFFEEDLGQFFKLRIYNDRSDAVRSFPIREAVRLEKTTRKTPKGKGNTRFGTFVLSDLDKLVDTRTGGNDALLSNEIMLVTSQAEFIDFMENVRVRAFNRISDTSINLVVISCLYTISNACINIYGTFLPYA